MFPAHSPAALPRVASRLRGLAALAWLAAVPALLADETLAEARETMAGVKLELNEQSEVWGSLAGGLRSGAAYNGLTTGAITADLHKVLGWRGATLFANAFHIHGRGPSTLHVGNQQLVSNIEGTPAIKLYNLWVEQELLSGALNVRVGQQGANDELMIAPSAAVFLNSSFGYPDLLAQDLPSGGPNYPLATPMVRAKLKINEQLTLVGAVFNGDPAGPGEGDPQLRNRFGTEFRLTDPPLSFLELWYTRKQDPRSHALPGIYKLGAFYHADKFDDQLRDTQGLSLADPLSSGVAKQHRGDFAVYAVADQTIWRSAIVKDRSLSVFGLVMAGPGDRNRVDFVAEAGLHLKAPFAGREQDVAGIAVAFARTSDSFLQLGQDVAAQTGTANGVRGHETVIEVTYLYHVTQALSLQPDVQVVFNPGAALQDSLTRPAPDHNVTIGLRVKVVWIRSPPGARRVNPKCQVGRSTVPILQPRRAAWIAATSIFFMLIIASNARFASAPPAAIASVSTRGVICQEIPHLSLHQPHALSWPPLPTMAFQ